MKVNEFVSKYKKMSSVQSVKNLITVKNYLPYKEKQSFVERIINMCILADEGYIWFDEMQKYIVFTIEIIKIYTNLEFDEDFNIAITEYDALCEAGALNGIIETFEGEYKTVLNMMSAHENQILQGNSVEAQVAKFLNGLNEKLDSVMDIISGQIGAFEGINISSEVIDKITSFLNASNK